MEMCAQRAAKALTTLIFGSLLFSGCGELDTVLPSTDTYRIKALVNNISLDECSLVSSTDKIQPYVASSVSVDPDVTGLMVYLENFQGQALGEKLVYSLNFDVKESAKESAKESSKVSVAENKTDKPKTQAESTPDDAPPDVKTENTKTENSTERKTADTPEISDAENSSEISAEVSDEVVAAAPTAAVLLIAATEEKIVPVKRLDRDLPAFSLPKNLAMGQYTLVFRILSKTENVQQIKRVFYYLGSARFSLKDIQIHLPGNTTGSQLVPLGAMVMLKTNLEFDSQLDPYLIWYNGKKVIGEGRLADGAGTLFWKAPEQNGFHSLRAEAFPFYAANQKIAGSSREVSLPVSSKAAQTLLFSGDVPHLLHWYQFGGNLKDAKDPYSANASLTPDAQQQPRWSAAAYSYGLASGAGEAWHLPMVSFARTDADDISGQIVFRFMPGGEGGLLSAVFESASAATTVVPTTVVAEATAIADKAASAALTLHVSLKEKTITVRMETPGFPPLEASKNLSNTTAFVTAALEFSIQNNRCEARLIPDYQIQQPLIEASVPDHDVLGVTMTARPSGNCRIVLGTPAKEAADKLPAPVAVWNELAVLQLTPKPPAAEPAAETVTQAAVQTVRAEPVKAAEATETVTVAENSLADTADAGKQETFSVPDEEAALEQQNGALPPSPNRPGQPAALKTHEVLF